MFSKAGCCSDPCPCLFGLYVGVVLRRVLVLLPESLPLTLVRAALPSAQCLDIIFLALYSPSQNFWLSSSLSWQLSFSTFSQLPVLKSRTRWSMVLPVCHLGISLVNSFLPSMTSWSDSGWHSVVCIPGDADRSRTIGVHILLMFDNFCLKRTYIPA